MEIILTYFFLGFNFFIVKVLVKLFTIKVIYDIFKLPKRGYIIKPTNGDYWESN